MRGRTADYISSVVLPRSVPERKSLEETLGGPSFFFESHPFDGYDDWELLLWLYLHLYLVRVWKTCEERAKEMGRVDECV